MINAAVIRQTIREAFMQPALLFAIIIEAAFVGLLTFGISLGFQNDVLVSMKFFGKEIHETLVNTFVSNLVESMVGLMSALLMFLFIIGSSFLYPSMLQDPLLGITLTKPISRTSLFFSKYAGFVLFVALSMILFSVAVWFILFSKTGGYVSDSVIVASVHFCFEFITVFAICSLLAMIVENASGVALLGIGTYYFLGPLMANTDNVHNPLITTISLVLPAIGKLSMITKDIVIHGDQPNPGLLVVSFAYSVVYIAFAIIIFNRKDLT
jgi:ABC-type transport system involved in multi-copper enzyme maturation permease subunit